MDGNRLRHLFVDGFFSTEKYTAAPRRGPEFLLPARDKQHPTRLRTDLDTAAQDNAANRSTENEEEESPIQLVIESDPDHLLSIDSLDLQSEGIEVVSAKIEGGVHRAVVHVPPGKLLHFRKRIEEYETKQTNKGKPKNQKLVDSIARIRLATLEHLWTDDSAFPATDDNLWWEVWVRKLGNQNIWDAFALSAKSDRVGLTVGTDTIEFPDRVVGLVFGTAEQLMASTELLDMIGEVRRAKENPADFIAMTPHDQAEWVNKFLPKVEPPRADAPAVCVLDGGIISNPLIAPAFSTEDAHCYDPNWPKADSQDRPITLRDEHGTEMAGVVLYGAELAELLQANNNHRLSHRLESARILPPKPRENERRLYGAITSQTISRVELTMPLRNRNFCMAVTTDGKDRGKPSSWSGVIDQICRGAMDDNPRLFFISTGNSDPNERHRYPDSNDTDSIQDPAQAWNAITVGAYTNCVMFNQTEFPGYEPIAPVGDLSPCSTTSLSWDKPWPYKPDIVLEGGNQIVVKGTKNVMDPDDLGLLTTAHATSGRLLVGFRDTSAATAQAARIGAIIQTEYPKLWPETVRALMIHSAEWTDAMCNVFGDKKRDHASRLRRYGYGCLT